MSARPLSDPYAVYGGKMASQNGSQPVGVDPYAAYGGRTALSQTPSPQQSFTANPNGEGVYKMNGPNGAVGIPFSNVYPAQKAGYSLDSSDAGRFQRDWAYAPNVRSMIAPSTPSLLDRALGPVRNSIIGNKLDQYAPTVAHALHLTPTETPSSPTYQSDKEQIISPQYLMPGNPQGHIAGITKGALTGAGKLTSPQSISTGVAIAATGGLAAPLAPLATGLRIAGIGMGGYGVGKDLYNAGQSYSAGDSRQGDEQLGEALPNAALTLPALGRPIESFGNAMQDKGTDLMNSYLKAGKKAFRYDADPGRGVLEQGPGTSVGFTREGFAQGVDAAKNRVGSAIPDIIDNSSAQIPRASLRSGQDAILKTNTDVLRGIGGNESNIAPLQDLRNTASPLVDTPGFASPREVYDAKKNLDANINWGRDIDPKDATENNMRREMRSDISGHLYNAVPDLAAPSRQYGDLSSAAKLATDRTFDRNGSVFNPFRLASMAGADLLTQGATHNPELSAGIGLATGLLPEIAKAPIVKTGGATALYQAGRGVASLGRGLSSFATPSSGAGDEDSTQYSIDAQPSEHENQRFGQSTPPSAPYRLQNLTPEIIRPGAMSRSQIGLGANGRAGTMIRPLAALPAPVIPPPEATPYNFVNRQPPPIAIPAVSPDALRGSVGTRAYTIPASLLGDLFEGGTQEQKAAALRKASLGSYGDLAPPRLFEPPQSTNAPAPKILQSRKFPGLRKDGEQ